MKNLRPSPAISVASNTSIGETLRIMRENHVGSVLVNSYSHPHSLEGIFTERDLLKWIPEIEKNRAWDKAIATIMTKNPVTLDLPDLDRAAEIMIEKGFRHVPIVYRLEGAIRVAGVVSMRDLFKGLVAERRERKVRDQFLGKRVVVLAHEPSGRDLQKRLLKDHVDLIVIERDFDQNPPGVLEVVSEVMASDLLVLDLDQFQVEYWVSILKAVLAQKHRPHVFVVYDPVLQESKSIVALKKLSQGSVVQVFPKPVNLLEYLRLMERSFKPSVKNP